MLWAILIFAIVYGGGTLAVAAWNHIRYKHTRQRYEPFTSSERRFRDRLPDGYLTVFLWTSLLGLYFLAQKAWTAANGQNPASATPLVAMLAVGIAIFSLGVSFLSGITSLKNLTHARISSAAQMICYMNEAEGEFVIRFENASSSAAAYDVKAVVGDEDPTTYRDKTKRFLGNDVVLLDAPAFPPNRFYDFKVPNITKADFDRGLNIQVKIEWTSFHDQPFASSFELTSPVSFRKIT